MSYTSYTETIFEKARETFGRDVYKAWPQVVSEYEHALWRVWNQNYGPLTPDQLQYATHLVCHALDKASGTDNPYASYKAQLRRLWTHETVDRGFKARAEKPVPNALRRMGELGFLGVPAA